MNCHSEKNDHNHKENEDVELSENSTDKKNDCEHEHKYSGHRHGWMMILCVLPMLVVMLYFMVKGDSVKSISWWGYLFIILCPLSHIFMMKGNNNYKKDKKSIEKEEEYEIK